VHEYSPLEIKKGVVGYGRAMKEQVQSMVGFLLNLPEPPKPSDAADALAVALCHANRMRAADLYDSCDREADDGAKASPQRRGESHKNTKAI